MIGVLLADFTKAFDTVAHKILLRAAQQKFKFSSMAYKWLSSYLSNREMRVKVDGNLSSAWPLPPAGVPQGSILGPLLFALYIDSLPAALQPYANHLFADDTSIWSLGKSAEIISSHLESAMDQLSQWSRENKIQLNPSKCKLLLIGTRLRLATQGGKLSVAHQGHNLISEESSRLLGLVLDPTLSFHDHIKQVVKRMNFGSHLLRKALPYLKPGLLTQLYFAFVHSHLIYCLEVWGPLTTKADVEKLEGVRNRCAKILLRGLGYLDVFDSRETRFQKLGWLPFNTLVVHRVLLQVYKIRNYAGPQYLRRLLQPLRSGTRQAERGDYHVPFRSTTIAQHAFSYLAPYYWNQLPEDVRNMPSIGSFKRCLANHLLASS